MDHISSLWRTVIIIIFNPAQKGNMESKEKMKLVIACFATVISIFFTAAFTHYIRLQSQKRHQNHQCYLKTTQHPKPQTTFKRVFADNSYAPFKHLSRNFEDQSSNLHPYIEEITPLMENPNQILTFNFVNGEEEEVDFEMKGSHVWVDTEDRLLNLVHILSNERVFAVDIEHHSLHSFLGFTCLMQISTHNKDYLVDAIALHDVMPLLRPVFADPNICKVFHGAGSDVLWLQRDFHIYVVNLFDTEKACDMLSKPHKSLAYLLETYCGVATNKLLQQEDWRLRPLSREMVEYARADAHYLLYITNCLATELKKQDTDCLYDKFPSVVEASQRSNMICLQLYTKNIEASPGDSAASSILLRYLNGKGGVPLECATKGLIGRLCMWRDLMARVHDESLRYVLSDQAIVVLALKVPKTIHETYDIIYKADMNTESSGVGSSVPSPSAVVCSHLDDLDYLLWEKISSSQEEIFEKILQKHLGPNGNCPLSVYNYALLSETNLKLADGFIAKQNGSKEDAKRVSGEPCKKKRLSRRDNCRVYASDALLSETNLKLADGFIAKQDGSKEDAKRVSGEPCKKKRLSHRDNCRVYASDGRFLGYTGRRKLELLVDGGVAKTVDDEPAAVRLLCERKGSIEDELVHHNVCVDCGATKGYRRYRITPNCYSMHFPAHLKLPHDVVLLCVDCHGIACSAAEKHKGQIAREFRIPLFVESMVGPTGVPRWRMQKCAYTLLYRGPNMPIKHREEMIQKVRKFFGGRKISEEDLERALMVEGKPKTKKEVSLKRENFSLNYLLELLNSNENMESSALAETSEGDIVNDLQMAQGPKDGQIISLEMDSGGGDGTFCSELEVIGSGCSDPHEVSDSYSCGSNGTCSAEDNKNIWFGPNGLHGKLVVELVLKEYGEEGIHQFRQRWRQAFVEAIQRFRPRPRQAFVF